MSSLTDEQRKIIEEKKKIAQAKLAANFAMRSIPLTSLFPSASTSSESSNSQCAIFNPGLVISTTPNGKNVRIHYNNVPTPQNIKCKPVSGKCELISKDRFIVHIGYHKKLIDTFKTIISSNYDPKTSEWSFHIKDHNQLIKSIKPLKRDVKLEMLPGFILKMFNTNESIKTDVSKIDISYIGDDWLDYLYPFQKLGIQFGVSKKGRCIIADDMGLGKTIQAIGIAKYYRNDFPLLIVCPSSVRHTWKEEICLRMPDVSAISIYVLTKLNQQVIDPVVVITSYDIMTKKCDMLLQFKFGITIFDECHSIKNEDSARTQVALSFAMQTSRCILLSGTPALSRPIELFTQIEAISQKNFIGMKEYGKRYCNGYYNYGLCGWDFSGASNMKELKTILETQFMIRRIKSEVLMELPQKNNKDMDAFEIVMNDKSLKKVEIRTALLQYFHLTGNVKLPAICDYGLKLLNEGKKFLVFAHHKIVMDGICDVLKQNGTCHIRIDGRTLSEKRKHVTDQFQTDDKYRVAVYQSVQQIQILTQAEDRAHRIGQLDIVTIQYLLARGTADDHLWPLIQSKLDILNKVGLSKDNFKDDSTTINECSTHLSQMNILDYLNDDSDLDEDDLKFLDKVEESESKRHKTC